MHSKKRTRRKQTRKAAKTNRTLGDVHCLPYVVSMFGLEVLLIVMVALSTPHKSTHEFKHSEVATIKANNVNYVGKEEKLEKEFLNQSEDFVESYAKQAKTHYENIATIKNEESYVDSSKDSAIIEEDIKTEAKENSFKDEGNDVDVPVKNDIKPENDIASVELAKGDISDAKVTEESLVETEKDEAKETAIKAENIENEEDTTEPKELVTEEAVVGTENLVTEEYTVENKESTVEEVAVGSEDPVLEVEKNVARSENVELLANIMYAEEGVFLQSDPANAERALKLCGSTVLHRVEVGFGGSTTMKEVLYAKGQYASATKRRVEKGQDIPDCVYKWAEELLTSGPIGPRNLVYQAQFKQGEVFEKVGNQYFCLSDKYEEPQEMMQVPESEIIVEEDSVEPQDTVEDPLVYDDIYIEGYGI